MMPACRLLCYTEVSTTILSTLPALRLMSPRPNYTLCINGFTPDTIPMARLAEYMRHFAAMLGCKESVRFRGLEPGSAQLVAEVEVEAVPEVEQRLAMVERGESEGKLLTDSTKLETAFREDGVDGFVYRNGDKEDIMVTLAGATRLETTIGPFWEEGSLDGVLVWIGGEDDTKHIQLRSGDIKYSGIEIDEGTARDMCKHLFEPVRVFGTGRWLRDEFGEWGLDKFRAMSFKLLSDEDVREVIAQLRSIEGSDWSKMDDPIAVALSLREDDRDVN